VRHRPKLAESITGTGYNVQYSVTQVANGEESYQRDLAVGAAKLPVNAGEKNTLVLNCSNESLSTEVRVYRRPENGISFGFIGSVNVSAGAATFIDYGGDADYTHAPPTWIDTFYSSFNLMAKTGCVYQQRMIVVNHSNDEVIDASRTGYPTNFLRDFPYSDDSALKFKAGSAGNAKVLHLFDNGGLIAFTTKGIYQSTGALSPTNISLEKKGNWVIEENVPPLEVPGALLFVDKSTNTVRTLIFSNEAGGFPGDEISIFSNHLFSNKKVKSWAFQDGDIPVVWVVFDDGSLVSLTYQRENQMQAWARHDSNGDTFECVTVLKDSSNKSIPYFLIKRGQKRFIEIGSDRFVSDLKDYIGMDASVTFKSELSSGGAAIDVTPVVPGEWEGLLNINSTLAVFANTAGNGAVGTIFRFFDAQGSAVDLEVTSYVNTKYVVVQPAPEFPSDQGYSIKLYKTYTTLTGLDHLEGKLVSITSDGYVIASPNNNIDNLPAVTVVGGQVTLDEPGAIVHVGLPFTSDVETLDIDTVEQKPTLLESSLVDKVYVKIYNSRGLYVGSSFPSNDKVGAEVGVDTMVDIEERDDSDMVENAVQPLSTKRIYQSVPNDWDSNGRVCFRQVDPLPFEILSIIPDLTILFRGS
jgi:hypothetical protein